MEIDLLGYVSSRVLSQWGENRLLYLIAFFSKNFNLMKYNYKIYNKKRLVMISNFQEWRPEHQRTGMLVKLITNHNSLKYFMNMKQSIRRQACWKEFLLRLNFVISYIVGKKIKKQIHELVAQMIFHQIIAIIVSNIYYKQFVLQKDWRLLWLKKKIITLLLIK